MGRVFARQPITRRVRLERTHRIRLESNHRYGYAVVGWELSRRSRHVVVERHLPRCLFAQKPKQRIDDVAIQTELDASYCHALLKVRTHVHGDVSTLKTRIALYDSEGKSVMESDFARTGEVLVDEKADGATGRITVFK